MENTEELLKEIKEKLSSLQSCVSKLEKALKEDNIKNEESVVLETPVEEPVVENAEVPEQSADLKLPGLEEDFSFELPKIEPSEPVLDKKEEEKEDSVKEETSISSEETPSLNETIKENDKTFIAGFKSSPSNLAEIKGHFSSDKLQTIISDLENDKIGEYDESKLKEETQTPHMPETSSIPEGEVQPNLSMPSDLINPVEETPVESKPEVVSENVQGEKEQPAIESNPEEVAENLAKNFGEEKRMRTVEEMLKEMELKFEAEGKGR